MHRFDAHAVAKVLEMECFQKHGKSGRPFFNSQVASTVRWLSTCNWEEFRARTSEVSPSLEALKTLITAGQPDQKAPETPRIEPSAAATPEDLVTDLATAEHHEVSAEVTNAALPSIPSFSNFLSKRKVPSSSREEQLLSGPRKKFKPPLMTKK